MPRLYARSPSFASRSPEPPSLAGALGLLDDVARSELIAGEKATDLHGHAAIHGAQTPVHS